MAGLLAWAADVVGGSGHGGSDEEGWLSSVVLTPEQKKYAGELDRKAAELHRVIQDLRSRIPPQDISKSLPHLHAHSLASNAALALQLNAHSTTRQQAQQREVTLKDENVAYEKAILSCQKKIQEKLQEADLLLSKLKDMDVSEKELREELDGLQSVMKGSQFVASVHNTKDPEGPPPRSDISKQVDDKKKELISMEETLQHLENEWTQVQQDSVKKPSPAEREKILERHLHDLIQQLTTKQAQAERLSSEIREKDVEFQKLNGFRQKLEGAVVEMSAPKNRFNRKFSTPALAYPSTETRTRHLNAGKLESQKKLMLFRSAIVLYILALHVIVFIKISF